MMTNATVYRFGLGDCTLGGVTSKKGSVSVSRDCDAKADLWIKSKDVYGDTHIYAEPSTDGMWAMGGNYIQLDDKSFVPVNDRDLGLESNQEVA